MEESEIEDVGEHSRLRVPVVYEVVRREGETEMRRPATSLWWSGVARATAARGCLTERRRGSRRIGG